MENEIMENHQPATLGNPVDNPVPPSHNLSDYSVNIRFFTIGCAVEIGCKTIAFESNQEMLKELTAYINNRRETVVKWYKIFKEFE